MACSMVTFTFILYFASIPSLVKPTTFRKKRGGAIFLSSCEHNLKGNPLWSFYILTVPFLAFINSPAWQPGCSVPLTLGCSSARNVVSANCWDTFDKRTGGFILTLERIFVSTEGLGPQTFHRNTQTFHTLIFGNEKSVTSHSSTKCCYRNVTASFTTCQQGSRGHQVRSMISPQRI